ncbi:hypothetical protein TIFTF001_017702 [Ficus carica]|uniref:Uncharacterized protein n=1 Tax=Ficus carica TaxID=3494 RepID=A0AA88DB01_FICCA|nr:hypothetical protein TIFTF001_017702 [Ficus carica]
MCQKRVMVRIPGWNDKLVTLLVLFLLLPDCKYDVGDPLLKEYAVDGVLVGGHVDLNADVVLDDGADDAGPSTGMHQDASSRAE